MISEQAFAIVILLMSVASYLFGRFDNHSYKEGEQHGREELLFQLFLDELKLATAAHAIGDENKTSFHIERMKSFNDRLPEWTQKLIKERAEKGYLKLHPELIVPLEGYGRVN